MGKNEWTLGNKVKRACQPTGGTPSPRLVTLNHCQASERWKDTLRVGPGSCECRLRRQI